MEKTRSRLCLLLLLATQLLCGHTYAMERVRDALGTPQAGPQAWHTPPARERATPRTQQAAADHGPAQASTPEPGTLRFSPSEWNFGEIREQDGKVTHTFTGRNEGTEPLVIVEVTTSCGCTTPDFSRKPILPGEQTRITVTFDPLNRPGSFSKELSVFSSRRERVARLRVTGSVIARERSVEEEYPFDFGEGLRLDGNYHAFAYLYRGREASTQFRAVNTTDEPMTLQLEALSPHSNLTLSCPRNLAPGEHIQIGISCLVPADSPTYGTVQEEVALILNGRRAPRTLTLHGLAVDAPRDKGPAPRMQLSESVVRFGTLRRSAGRQSLPLRIANGGDAALNVRAVELQTGIGCSLRAGDRLAPGETREATVTLDPQALDYGAASARLLLVTDDRQHPTRTLRITAIIED